MRRGFTVLEMLVAALILGILSTILGMVFNQSAVAWRVGSAQVSNLDGVRDNMAALREEADNAFVADGQVRRLIGLWKSDGTFQDRACDMTRGGSPLSTDRNRFQAQILQQKESALGAAPATRALWSSAQNVFPNIGRQKAAGMAHNYIVNVKSAGPDGKFDTYDDIWSFPDDFE